MFGKKIVIIQNKKMKKILLSCLIIIMGISIQAQNEDYRWGVYLTGGKMAYNGDKGNGFFNFDDQPFQGHGGLKVARYLSDNLDLVLSGSFGRHGLHSGENPEVNFLTNVVQGNLGVHYKILKGKKITPFLSGALGLMNYSDEDGNAENSTDFQIPLGIGAKWMFSDRFGLIWNSQYGINFGDTYDGAYPDVAPQGVDWDGNDSHLFHELGFAMFLGLNDRDGDKVADSKDDCPDTPGLKQYNGCPDTDLDGIIDGDDDCPEVAGLAEYNGCPDTDGDGVIDKEDDCPDVAGTVVGCPDADEDGIADKDDDCPEEAGLETFGGCPDTDGDGIMDKEDNCPEEAGTVEGCPDSDGDGVADVNDECPDIAGDEANGCPSDSDGDGVRDDLDRCPDEAGPVDGCPDSDGDGVPDYRDKCPDRGGARIDADGCPKRLFIPAFYFDSGSKIQYSKSSFVSELDAVVSIMQANPQVSVSVEGHSDDRGGAAANKRLSEKRAKDVMDYLIKRGIDPSRLSHLGHGEERPIADNETEEGRKMNRRVEFVVSGY